MHADPVSWVRQRAYEYALSPWHRFRDTVKRDDPAPKGTMGAALLRLRPLHRRTLVMCDGLGLTIAEAAAELEASPAATRSGCFTRTPLSWSSSPAATRADCASR